MLEKLWNEHFAEECAVVSSDEERLLLERAGDLHKILNESLSKEQSELAEKYIEATYEVQGVFLKKAFFLGCKFGVSFILDSRGYKK